MAIKNYTTKVDVYTSIGEIQGALARHGATKIMIDYDNGKPQAIAFGIDTPAGPRGFRLPAAADGTLRVFAAQKIKADREQAERNAASVRGAEDQGRPRAGRNDRVAERARLGAGTNGADRIL